MILAVRYDAAASEEFMYFNAVTCQAYASQVCFFCNFTEY
jgi:hypothetical protein